ncbi:hypothetical protein GCM10010468_18700 [Actinocorallia longicatena]|uniref:histidine kinase n=2 Tax=Actinocorallia longicatena TaxID=111803 RepID=A0ABP6Q4H2_9ACTN
MLTIPLASLIILWAFVAGTSLRTALENRSYNADYKLLTTPMGMMTFQLSSERTVAGSALGDPGPATLRAFRGETAKTDAVIDALRASVADYTRKHHEAAGGASDLASFVDSLSDLGAIREQVAPGTSDRVAALRGYDALSDRMFQAIAQLRRGAEVRRYQTIQTLITWSWSRDVVEREVAYLAAAAPKGKLPARYTAGFAALSGARQNLYLLAGNRVDGLAGVVVAEFTQSPAYDRYARAEQRIADGSGDAASIGEFRAAAAAVSPLWLVQGNRVSTGADRDAAATARNNELRVYLLGGVGFLLVMLSVALVVRFARGITRELRALRGAARELARNRLPDVVLRLRRGDTVDVAAEAPRLPGGRTREIQEVGESFADVQRTAVDLAVAESRLRGAINQVFVNLSWRNQGLLMRQLKLLDSMERRVQSPEELEELFRLDHLTTRMRRHAEGLVILTGAPTVRVWDRPVAAEDIVRAALAEIEDYERVELSVTAPVAVAAEAVGDVIHLLAELVENAAMFSPPTTAVEVKLDAVANGLVIEVIDRGIGVPDEQMAAINRRLETPPDFDLADTDRLGLFVVARLASRHDIRVRLQRSSYGGTVAVVLVPSRLVLPEEVLQGPGRPPLPPAEPPRPGRHAGPPSPVAAVPPPAAVAGPAPVEQRGTESGGLPRRRRRENLAPALLEPGPPAGGSSPAFTAPDPDASRDLLSSLQQGWDLGRNEEVRPLEDRGNP